MPNRVIRDSVLESDRYNGLPFAEERLLFLELLLLADDFGLVPLNFAFVSRRTSLCARMTTEQINGMLEHLIEADLLRTYRSESGALFGFIPRFGNKPRAKKPKWPLPPREPAFNEINKLADSCGANAHQMQTNAPETETETETESPKGDGYGAEHGSTPDACPHQEILKLWAEKLPSLPQPREWTDSRAQLLKTRWREKKNRQNLEWWSRFFEYLSTSDFLMGRQSTPGRKAFELTLPWLLKQENFVKCIEGNYHTKETA